MLAESPMRSLVLNGATLGAGSLGDVAGFVGTECIIHEPLEGIGATASLASTCQSLFRRLGWDKGPDRIIAVTGPGSFTGLRASLALADGLSFGFGSRLHGVTTGQCFRANPDWANTICLTYARRNRIFAEFPDGQFWAGAPDDLTLPDGAQIIGSGVSMITNTNIEPIDQPRPDLRLVFSAGLTASAVTALQPFYIDAPEAKPPAQGLRPAPIR